MPIIISVLKKCLKFSVVFLKNIKYHRFGRCNICGKYTIFLNITDKYSARETMNCIFCRSSSRRRHVALIILKQSNNFRIKTLKLFGKNTNFDIYNTDDNIYAKYFKNKSNYVSSIYSDDYKIGTEIKNNFFCQNIENLTFSNESFDIVITEDVLEHIRNYRKAFEEIYRVLKNGGVHIFTIPFMFDRETIIRIDSSTDEDINILPPEYHGDEKRGKIIAYRTFGYDLYKLLVKIGFNTTVHLCTLDDSNYGIYNSSVFVSRKDKVVKIGTSFNKR
jgi:SAM-dependent methyltransferase